MSSHFYDGQIRRYLIQLIRMLSNFKYKDGAGVEREIPAIYGDMSKQVASIISNNSENKIPCAPRMAIYITGLEADRARQRDATFVDKVNIRERAYDEAGKEYLNTQGKNYTVERLMPVPYQLTINADLWTTNTDQKLQILEQIMTIFRPTLEIQTTDNFVDWTSLSVVNLENLVFSSRSVPQGVGSEIDIATLTFSTPIWINPPVKVKRLGVITNIITSIHDESKGTIELGLSTPELSQYNNPVLSGAVDDFDTGNKTIENNETQTVVGVNYLDYDLYINGTSAKLARNGMTIDANWLSITEPHPGTYQDNISRVYLVRKLNDYFEMTGTFTINELSQGEIAVNWDTDSFPDDTQIDGPARNTNAFTSIDYIINPLKTNPTDLKFPGLRLLLLENIGDANSTDGPSAWKNTNGTSLVAGTNDIVEWTGTSWSIVFNASNNTNIEEFVYTTNLNTNVQYRWDGRDWMLSVDGIYPAGTWRLALDG